MIDDATAAYILETQRCFEDLKQVASQLAGWLVLAASGSKEALPDHPALEAAGELYREADDGLRRAHPTERGQQHYDHLARGASAIGAALREVNSRLDVDRVLIPLRAGYTELERAADSLPGFEKVSYDLACCGGVRLKGHA
jgi:hypothetical protein